jgi:NitT/TauT family transport system substrate-binding protein
MSMRRIMKFGLALSAVVLSAYAVQAETVRLARSTMSIGGLPIIIAQQKGMFEKAGLTVEVNDFKGGAPAVQALASGSVDACLCAGDHVIRLTNRGLPAKILIGLSDKHGYTLMAPADSTATDLASLKGKRIGITSAGSQTDNTIRYELKKNGMDGDTDVQLINIGTGGAMQAALVSGAVDAGMFPTPFTEANIRDGLKMVVDFRVKSYPSLTVLALEKFVKERPQVAKSFVQTILAAQKAMQADKSIAMSAAKELFPDLDEELLNTVVDDFLKSNIPPGGLIDPEGFQEMTEMVTMADSSTSPIPYEQAVAADLLK